MAIKLKEGVMDAPEQHFKPSNPNPFDEARKEEAAKKAQKPEVAPDDQAPSKLAKELNKMKESVDEDLGIEEKEPPVGTGKKPKLNKSSKKSALGRAGKKRNARASKK